MWIQRFRNLSVAARVASLAGVAAVAVWSAVWISPDVDESQPPVQESSPAQPPGNPVAPPPSAAVEPQSSVQQPPVATVTAPRVAPAAPEKPTKERDPRAELRQALASENAGTRIDALRTAAELRTVQALPDLLAMDITRDPEVAPTLVQVTGRLAQHADASQRGAAVSQLSRWLQSESTREGAAARGNVSVLVETLADFQAPEAQSALIEVLQSGKQPLHVQTLAVEGLAKLGTPAAQAALTQFRAQLGQTERQGFERELQREAEQATDRALARLSR